MPASKLIASLKTEADTKADAGFDEVFSDVDQSVLLEEVEWHVMLQDLRKEDDNDET